MSAADRSELDAVAARRARDERDEPDRDALAALATAGRGAAGAVSAPPVDDDLTREFWGDAPGWRPSGRTRRTRAHGATAEHGRMDETTASGEQRPARAATSGEQRRTRTGASGEQRRTRTHATARPAGTRQHAVLYDGRDGDGPWSDDGRMEIPLDPSAMSFAERIGVGDVDPRLVRIGAVVMAAIVLVSVLLGVRALSGGDELGLRSLVSADAADWRALPRVARGSDESTVTTVAATDVETPGAPGGSDPGVAPAVQSEAAEPAPCPVVHEVAPGDYWVGLADGAGVPLADLLAVNDATVETVIHPGEEICLPEGAAIPPPVAPPTSATDAGDEGEASGASARTGDTASSASPSGSSSGTTAPAPATTAPATTAPASTAPATTAPPTTAPPTTAPPTTAAAPTTAAPTTAAPAPPAANPSTAQVQAIIREVFPADQHETALAVAHRESRFQADAYNGWCCYGVFQIHWNAHKSWLQGLGITSASALYDARTNVELAYEIYQRAGGWGPWGG